MGERFFRGFFVRTLIQSFTRHCAVASMGSEARGGTATIRSEEQRSEGRSRTETRERTVMRERALGEAQRNEAQSQVPASDIGCFFVRGVLQGNNIFYL